MNIQNIVVKSDRPYPELTDTSADPSTVDMLKNLVASRMGILSSALQHMCQSVVAEKTSPEIGSVFQEMGVVEVMHLNMLMHAITQFGGQPRLEDSARNPYSAAALNTSPKLKDMLDFDLQQKQYMIRELTTAQQRVKNASLADLLTRIIEDERLHQTALNQIKDNVEFLSI